MLPREVSGDVAHGYVAIRTDSYLQINDGLLLAADEITGAVRWKDKTDTEKTVTLGPHAIRIISRGHGSRF